MLQEGKGPINFTVFLTLFGEKLNGEPGAGLGPPGQAESRNPAWPLPTQRNPPLHPRPLGTSRPKYQLGVENVPSASTAESQVTVSWSGLRTSGTLGLSGPPETLRFWDILPPLGCGGLPCTLGSF